MKENKKPTSTSNHQETYIILNDILLFVDSRNLTKFIHILLIINKENKVLKMQIVG